jgi:hypothetical protein
MRFGIIPDHTCLILVIWDFNRTSKILQLGALACVGHGMPWGKGENLTHLHPNHSAKLFSAQALLDDLA